MVISLKEGSAADVVVKRLRDIGATVKPIEFTSYFRVDGIEGDAALKVEGVKKVGETIKELR